LEGIASGRQLKFRRHGVRPGEGWFDLAADGQTLAGAAGTDGFAAWFGWRGRRAPEYSRHAKLVAGTIVDGSTRGLLTYSVRAPDDYQEGDGKPWPAIVILHGSNMNGKAYVNTIAASWPDVAKRNVVIGLNGELPSSTGDDPRFNYTYVNFVGRSTFRGFPGTDRESPALVAEALDEFREVYPVSRFFVGGHSQGGFLSYSLLMNYPEKIAGAFPISAGVIFQCEPSAYDDDALRAAQRAVPLAIVHGRTDPAVPFSSGEYAAALFAEAGWPALRFIDDDSGAGHMFARLPVAEAIGWLEAHAENDVAKLVDFAAQRMKAPGGLRDAVAALNRARPLSATEDDALKLRVEQLARQIDAQAQAGAQEFLPKIAGNDGPAWIDEFLAFRDDFEFAPGANEVMQAFASLRAQHEAPARQALADARKAFQQGNRDEGYAKYQEIADRFYAASSYRNVKRWLAERE
jgi:predicted esterase